MVVKVYGVIISPYVQIVILTLKEIGIPFEVVPIDPTSGQNKAPEYLAKQPFGQIPVLEDEDGFAVYESRAIARYLVSKYAPDSGLIPKDVKEIALFEQAASNEVSNYSPHAFGIAWEGFFKPFFSTDPKDEVKTAGYKSTLEAKLKVYDTILSKQKYIAGNKFTLADIFHIPMGAAVIYHTGYKAFDAHPNVKRWWDELTSRPSFKEVWAGVDAFKAQVKN